MAIAARPGAHARPGAADALHAHGLRPLPAALARLDRQPGRPSGRYYPEEKHPISRVLFAVYEPACRFVLRHPKTTIARRAARRGRRPSRSTSSSATSSCRRSTRATILYMPTTLPGHLRHRGAAGCCRSQDRILKAFPEVERVFGKAGRAETSTDPAPFSMMETTVVLKPPSEWRPKERWYSSWAPEWLKALVLAARLARPHLLGRARSPRWTGRCRSPARRTPGPCRSRRASTCSRPASARRSASRSSAPTSSEIERIGARARGGPARRSRDAQRLRRARRRRLLRRLRPEARRARPLRPHGRGRRRT